VGFRLIPREEKFFDDFQALADQIRAGADLLEQMLAPDHPIWDKAEEIKEVEHRCDSLTHAIIERLNRTFVTPLDREDIHALAEELDDVVDEMQAAADLLVLHRVVKPLPEVRDLADILVKAAEANVALLAKLPRLRDMDSELEAIGQLESEGDRVYRRLVAHLFSGEFKAFNVLKWKDIVEAIEKSVNAIENISDIVESIVLKHA